MANNLELWKRWYVWRYCMPSPCHGQWSTCCPTKSTSACLSLYLERLLLIFIIYSFHLFYVSSAWSEFDDEHFRVAKYWNQIELFDIFDQRRIIVLQKCVFFHNMDIGCKGQREQNINVEIMSLMSCPGLCNKKIADVAYRLHNQRLAEKENTAKQISFSFPSLQELHLWWLLHFSYWH